MRLGLLLRTRKWDTDGEVVHPHWLVAEPSFKPWQFGAGTCSVVPLSCIISLYCCHFSLVLREGDSFVVTLFNTSPLHRVFPLICTLASHRDVRLVDPTRTILLMDGCVPAKVTKSNVAVTLNPEVLRGLRAPGHLSGLIFPLIARTTPTLAPHSPLQILLFLQQQEDCSIDLEISHRPELEMMVFYL